MAPAALTPRRFNWQLPILAAILAPVLFIPLVLWSPDFGPIAYSLLVTPLVCLVLLIAFFVIKHQKLAIASMLVIYCFFAWILSNNSEQIRSHLRWLFDSRDYKAKLLSQPTPSNGELRHIAWERYGWVTINTDIDLVYDPEDTLLDQTRAHGEGKFTGIPCPVYQIHRLEPHWFTIRFYTDTTWNQCGTQ